MSVCFVCHPYTARKDIGAGSDRYSYELIHHYEALFGKATVLEAGVNRNLLTALAAEPPFVLKLLKTRAGLYHATSSASGASTLRLRKRPLVTTVHDLISLHADPKNDSRWKFFYKKRAIIKVCAESDGIIVPFRSTQLELINELKVPRDRVRLVPYGIDPAQFYSGVKPKNARRKILFIGSLTKGKGVDTLIRAWDQIAAKLDDAVLHLCSGGWDSQLMQSLVRESRYRDRILMRGFIPESELRGEYLSADVSVFPSRYGFGLPTLESMACGTATVSGRTLDAPEFVEDAGLLANPDDPEELATQILNVLENSELRERLEKRGLEKATQYRWSETARRTFDVYREFG